MDSTRHHWGADVPISRPVSNEDHPSVVDLGGFGFGEGGITVTATNQEIDEQLTPYFHPRTSIEDLFNGQRP